MIIAHNITAINTYRQYGINFKNKSKTLEKLSSGYRINRAGDDAAGLAISESMRRSIQGMKQGIANAQDGIGLVETAEGAMQEISAMLRRMNQLAVKSANGTYTNKERAVIQEEVDQLKEEIDRISDHTEFNGVFLFKREFDKAPEVIISGSATIQPGTALPNWVGQSKSFREGRMVEKMELYDPAEPYQNQKGGSGKGIRRGGSLDFSKLNATNVKDLIGKGFHSTCFTCDNHYSIMFVGGTGCKTEQSGQHYVTKIGIDGVKNGKELVERILEKTNSNDKTDTQKIIGNMGTRHFTRLQQDSHNQNILVMYDMRQASSSGTSVSGGKLPEVYFQDPNYGKANYGVALAPGDVVIPPPQPVKTGDLAIQLGASRDDILWINLPTASTAFLEVKEISVLTRGEASEAIGSLKDAINLLSKERGRMGAYENRLEHAMQSIKVTCENMTAAESRIRDADMALLVADLAKEGVLEQATQAMLAQANTTPQGVLSLLNA